MKIVFNLKLGELTNTRTYPRAKQITLLIQFTTPAGSNVDSSPASRKIRERFTNKSQQIESLNNFKIRTTYNNSRNLYGS